MQLSIALLDPERPQFSVRRRYLMSSKRAPSGSQFDASVRQDGVPIKGHGKYTSAQNIATEKHIKPAARLWYELDADHLNSKHLRWNHSRGRYGPAWECKYNLKLIGVSCRNPLCMADGNFAYR